MEEDPNITTATLNILSEIARERKAQDAKHGGPENDDHHSTEDWALFLAHHLGQTVRAIVDGNEAGYRQELIEMAALSVAAIEAFDRMGKLLHNGNGIKD